MKTAKEYALIAQSARIKNPLLTDQLALVELAVADASSNGRYKAAVDLPEAPHEWLLDTLREKGFIVGCKKGGSLVTISW